jgi:hypothetical protein
MSEENPKIILYQTEDGKAKIDVKLDDETVWLTQGQMVKLFQKSKQNISLHIKNIFSEGELEEVSVVKEYLTTAQDGKRYQTKHMEEKVKAELRKYNERKNDRKSLSSPKNEHGN